MENHPKRATRSSAAYSFAISRDPELGKQSDRIAGLVLACQKEVGCINTQVPPNSRFDPKINHDLYTAGHFFEAAVAHYRATGKRDLLDAARALGGLPHTRKLDW